MLQLESLRNGLKTASEASSVGGGVVGNEPDKNGSDREPEAKAGAYPKLATYG